MMFCWVGLLGGILLLIFLVVEKKVQNDIHHWHFRKKLAWIFSFNFDSY